MKNKMETIKQAARKLFEQHGLKFEPVDLKKGRPKEGFSVSFDRLEVSTNLLNGIAEALRGSQEAKEHPNAKDLRFSVFTGKNNLLTVHDMKLFDEG